MSAQSLHHLEVQNLGQLKSVKKIGNQFESLQHLSCQMKESDVASLLYLLEKSVNSLDTIAISLEYGSDHKWDLQNFEKFLDRFVKGASKLKLTQLKKVEVHVLNVPKDGLADNKSFLSLVKLFPKDSQTVASEWESVDKQDDDDHGDADTDAMSDCSESDSEDSDQDSEQNSGSPSSDDGTSDSACRLECRAKYKCCIKVQGYLHL
eukprot:TRINITY_DN21041_c0_g1_i6.p1 TRINITY_DN21041_c0_g1~~TRINITY_DN21041_c0_g1_i6.p1  ORF type:complete len:222 (+),score=62.65 TRINITY_DN21041_c0_g1_i6:47-667(+)